MLVFWASMDSKSSTRSDVGGSNPILHQGSMGGWRAAQDSIPVSEGAILDAAAGPVVWDGKNPHRTMIGSSGREENVMYNIPVKYW